MKIFKRSSDGEIRTYQQKDLSGSDSEIVKSDEELFLQVYGLKTPEPFDVADIDTWPANAKDVDLIDGKLEVTEFTQDEIDGAKAGLPSERLKKAPAGSDAQKQALLDYLGIK